MVEFIKYKGFDHVWQYSGPWLWWLVGFYLCLPLTAYVILPYLTTKGTFSGSRRTISIFVLGDLGHSPRMNYHARSFSKLEYFVNLCGYLESQPPVEIIDDINIELYPIAAIKNTSNLPYILFALRKISAQVLQLVKLLFKFRGSEYIMIQNPPSIPILFIAIVFIKIFSRETKLIIDWHNLNYSILNLKFQNEEHYLVKFLKNYERILGKYADLNITVTKKMKEFLIEEFGIKKKKIITLHDRPAEQFVPFSGNPKSKIELMNSFDLFNSIEAIEKYKVLVSSTSFTPDEDFNILLDALKKYDTSLNSLLPPILLIVTGKGPLKNQFNRRVEELQFLKNVIIKSAWLSFEDYPTILSLADLGISLHTSSSGIDLPMKIVDFFGVGVPVISLNFPAIDELVKDEVNGFVTKNNKDYSIKESDEIYRLLIKVFSDSNQLAKIKKGAIEESKKRWDQNWDAKLGSKFTYYQEVVN